MIFSPLSFLIGLGAAWALPVVAKSFRSLTVEMTVAGLALMDEARRVIAEQREHLEDIAAEARARHEERQTAQEGEPEVADFAEAEGGDNPTEGSGENNGDASAASRRRRRRAPATSR